MPDEFKAEVKVDAPYGYFVEKGYTHYKSGRHVTGRFFIERSIPDIQRIFGAQMMTNVSRAFRSGKNWFKFVYVGSRFVTKFRVPSPHTGRI